LEKDQCRDIELGVGWKIILQLILSKWDVKLLKGFVPEVRVHLQVRVKEKVNEFNCLLICYTMWSGNINRRFRGDYCLRRRVDILIMMGQKRMKGWLYIIWHHVHDAR
jgi:hypothetical protein